jgi:hypothetical protein
MLSVYLICCSYLIICYDLLFKLMLNSRQFLLEDCIFEDLARYIMMYGIGCRIYYVAGLVTYKLPYVTGNSSVISTFQ